MRKSQLELNNEGYELSRKLQAGLPLQVWRVEMEIERQHKVSDGERCVLKLLYSGVSDVPRLTQMMGLGTDKRLVERKLVKLLKGSAIAADEAGFVLTQTGLGWMKEGSTAKRERVTHELRLDPIHDRLEWVNGEQSMYGTADTWTIESKRASDADLLERLPEISELIRTQGLPGDEDKSPLEQSAAMELRSLAVADRRIHYRYVTIDVMKHPHGDRQFIGYIGGAENPPLSKFIALHVPYEHQQRFALRNGVDAQR